MSASILLTENDFKNVIKNAPLFSFDIIVKNSSNQIIVGLRSNAPAKGYWFVPGGRIRKDEDFQEAFSRLANDELSINVSADKFNQIFPNPSGTLFIHHYPNDNNFQIPGVNTHYIVFPIIINLSRTMQLKHDSQHHDLKWITISELLKDEKVHANTKNYFNKKHKIPQINL